MTIEKNTPSILVKEQIYYTTIQNNVLQNIHNGFALGVYCYLSSQFEGWEVCINQLKSHFGCGRDKIRSALNHLKEKGLYERNPVKNDKGIILQWESILRSTIHITENPSCGTSSTLLKIQRLDNPATGKSDTINNRSLEIIEKHINKEKIYKKENFQINVEEKIASEQNISINVKTKEQENMYQETYYPTTTSTALELKDKSKKLAKPKKTTRKAKFGLDDAIKDNPMGIEETFIEDWYHFRGDKNKPVNSTVWARINGKLNKCIEAGYDANECFGLMVEKGWLSLEISWVENTLGTKEVQKGQYDNSDLDWLDRKNKESILV